MGVMRAGAGQAVGHIGEIEIGMADQMFVQPAGLRGQCRGGARRNQPHWQPELDTVTGLQDRAPRVVRSGPAGWSGCCRITCALVPLIPNEDTAAVRG